MKKKQPKMITLILSAPPHLHTILCTYNHRTPPPTKNFVIKLMFL